MSTALVLGGGGVTGVAWEIGLLYGLAEAGIDLTTADLVIGTSAGSVVGAQITSGTALSVFYERQIEGYGQEIAGKIGLRFTRSLVFGMLRYRDPVRFRQHIGRMALATDTVSESERLAVIAGRLPSPDWPASDLRIVAVNAQTGEVDVFTRDSGVSLVDAVAASCAVPGVWPPVTIHARESLDPGSGGDAEGRFIDGGMRSVANADLAAGSDRIIVLAPITRGGGPMPSVARQVADLTKAGAHVVVIEPDTASVAAIGRNALDPSRRAPTAKAGREQAASSAARVAALWSAA